MSKVLDHILSLYKEAQVKKKADFDCVKEKIQELNHQNKNKKINEQGPKKNKYKVKVNGMYLKIQTVDAENEEEAKKLFHKILPNTDINKIEVEPCIKRNAQVAKKAGEKESFIDDYPIGTELKLKDGRECIVKGKTYGSGGVVTDEYITVIFPAEDDHEEDIAREDIEQVITFASKKTKLTKKAEISNKLKEIAPQLKKSAMIIDVILDRKNGASYNPQDFYDYVSQQLDVLNSKDIARALDSGTEEDVKKALCEYIRLGEYDPILCDYINSIWWLEEEDIEQWFSIKLNKEQAKEFAKLLTEYGIKNKSEEEGGEIKVSFFILPSSKGIVIGLLSNTLSRFPDKQAKLNKQAEDKESAKKDYTEQYAKVKEIMKEYGYGLSDGGYIYLISKEAPKDEGFQVKFKGDRLRVELDGKLTYSGYGPEAIEDFLKGMFYAKKQSSKNTKLTKKAMRKRAYSVGDYLAHFNDVQQYALVENKGDLGKAVEYLLTFASSEYDKKNFPREYVYKLVKKYIDDTVKFQEMINHPIKEDYIVKAKELLNNYKVENKIASKTNKLQKKANKTLEEVAGLIDTILDDFDHYDYVDQLEVGETSAYESILADVQKDEKGTIESLFARIKEDDSDEPFTSKELDQLKEYYNNKFGKSATTKQAGNKLYIAKLYDKDGVKYDNLGKSENIDELKDLLRDWLFEKRKNRETNPKNNKFYLQDKIVIEDYNTGEPIETIKVSDLLSTYGKDYWKPFMETKATKKKAVLQVSENGMGYVLPNGQVVYPGDEAYVKSELKGDKELLEKTNAKIIRLEKAVEEIKKEYPNVDLSKYPDSALFQLDRELKLKETLELCIETEEEILNAFKENKLPRQATKKQATIKHENGVYNVYSESGKCLGKGYKTKEEAEKRLKQVEYFKNKKAVTGTDYWGPKEIPDEEEEGTFIIRYYGGPGHIDYLRKSRNGKYHWVEQTHFDYINDKPFETTDYELAKKLVEQYGGEIEKKESKQVNNKRTSLKQIVISKMAENEKIDWDNIWGIEYNGKKYMLQENMGTLYSFINMEDLKNNKITNKSYITFNMMQITKKVKEGKMLVIYDY